MEFIGYDLEEYVREYFESVGYDYTEDQVDSFLTFMGASFQELLITDKENADNSMPSYFNDWFDYYQEEKIRKEMEAGEEQEMAIEDYFDIALDAPETDPSVLEEYFDTYYAGVDFPFVYNRYSDDVLYLCTDFKPLVDDYFQARKDEGYEIIYDDESSDFERARDIKQYLKDMIAYVEDSSSTFVDWCYNNTDIVWSWFRVDREYDPGKDKFVIRNDWHDFTYDTPPVDWYMNNEDIFVNRELPDHTDGTISRSDEWCQDILKVPSHQELVEYFSKFPVEYKYSDFPYVLSKCLIASPCRIQSYAGLFTYAISDLMNTSLSHLIYESYNTPNPVEYICSQVWHAIKVKRPKYFPLWICDTAADLYRSVKEARRQEKAYNNRYNNTGKKGVMSSFIDTVLGRQ